MKDRDADGPDSQEVFYVVREKSDDNEVDPDDKYF